GHLNIDIGCPFRCPIRYAHIKRYSLPPLRTALTARCAFSFHFARFTPITRSHRHSEISPTTETARTEKASPATRAYVCGDDTTSRLVMSLPLRNSPPSVARLLDRK